jgi:hypothetical protein
MNAGSEFIGTISKPLISDEPTIKACWYTMPEKPEFVMGTMYQGIYGDCTTSYPLNNNITFNIDEIIINNTSLAFNIYEYIMTQGNIEWVVANNDIVYNCTPGEITGQTYTNFVTFLNSVFASLSLNGYKAQISLKEQKIGDRRYNQHNGFYIIYPTKDKFSIKTSTNTNTDKYKYTSSGITEWSSNDGWSNKYNKSFCDGIIVKDGKVIE